MAIQLSSANFSGKNGDKFQAVISYDLVERNIAGNYSIIRYYLHFKSLGYSGSGSTVRGYINGQQVGTCTSISKNESKMMGYIDVQVNHNDAGVFPGNVYSFSINTSWTLGNASGNGTLPVGSIETIPRASSISFPGGTIGGTLPITIHAASSEFRHTLTYYFGSMSAVIASNLAGQVYEWTVPTSLYSQIPNAAIGVGGIRVDTYYGQTHVGSYDATLYLYANENECKPSISLNVEDTNQKSILLTGNKNKLIRYVSNAKAVINAVAKNYSSITGVSCSCSDGQAANNSEITFNNVGGGTFTGYVTDSRGYSNQTTVIKDIVDYVRLTVNQRIYRPQPTENVLKMEITGNYFNGSFGTADNTLNLKYRFKEAGTTFSDEDTYTNITAEITETGYKVDATLDGEFDYRKAYDFEIVASDKVMEVPITEHVSEGIPMMALFKEWIEFFGSKTFYKENDKLKIDGSFEIKDTGKTLNDIATIAFLNNEDFQVSDLNDVLTTGLVSFTPNTANIPIDGAYGICLTFVNYTTSYNSRNNWIWQIVLDTNQTSPSIHLRNRINAGAWNVWKRFG